MTNSISICLRVDGSEALGLGHLSRCRALILALKTIEPGCRFSVATETKEVALRLLAGIEAAVCSPEQAPHANMTIVDVPGGTVQDWALEARGLLVCIDDDGPGLERQDILIRPNLLDLPKPSGIDEAQYWSGRDYIILHPDFARQPVRDRGGEVGELLVCFGGSDPAGVTLRSIPLMKGLPMDVKIHIVLGQAFSRREEAVQLAGDDGRFRFSFGATRMAEYFFRADAAFISGGTLLYEVCASGVPAVVVSQNTAQAAEAAICRRSGAALDLGIHNEIRDEEIAKSLTDFLADAVLRRNMAQQALKAVPSDGASRIASTLLARVN